MLVKRLLIITALVAASLAGPSVAHADTPGCVTEAEFLAVRNGLPRAQVNQIFDTDGRFLDGGAGGFVRSYRRCSSATGTVRLLFALPNYGGPPVLARKKWLAPTPGDVHVHVGTPGANGFHIMFTNDRDHVYAGPGNDTIDAMMDGWPDVINCGPGFDWVIHSGPREAHDRYFDCERFSFLTD